MNKNRLLHRKFWIWGLTILLPVTLISACIWHFDPDFEFPPRPWQPPTLPFSIQIPASKANQTVSFTIRALSDRGSGVALVFNFATDEQRKKLHALVCGPEKNAIEQWFSKEERESLSVVVPLRIRIFEQQADKSEKLIHDAISKNSGCSGGGSAPPSFVSRSLLGANTHKKKNYRFEVTTLENNYALEKIDVGIYIYGISKYRF
jgi:Domain of unknown function (DUF5625)